MCARARPLPDLVCAVHGCGQETVQRFLRFAADHLRRRAVRIHAVTALRGWWLNTFHFHQAESVLLRDGRCVLADYGPRSYRFEAANGWNPTWRMCRILQAAAPRGYVAPREATDPQGAARDPPPAGSSSARRAGGDGRRSSGTADAPRTRRAPDRFQSPARGR